MYVPMGEEYGGGGTWMDRLFGAGIGELIISVSAVYKMSKTSKSQFLDFYLVSKCSVLIWLISGVIGLTTTKIRMIIPSMILLWNCVLIGTIFIFRLDQRVGGSR